MKTVTLEGTQELMKHRDVAVILATGGMGLVRAAYSAGKPAYGVGPGNAPCFIERTRRSRQGRQRHHHRQDVRQRRALLVAELGRRRERGRRRGEARVRRGRARYFLSPAEADKLAAVLVTPQRLPNPKLVGKSGDVHRRAGRHRGARRHARAHRGARRASAATIPLSIEKLCPVLSYYVVADWREGCERCIQILRYGGMGHTMSIHSRNEQVILEFGLKKPAFRIVVNTPTTHGSIGLTTGLDPAMTLGCGGYGGNITSDNISPRHLLNIKRLAYELRPADRYAAPARRAERRRAEPGLPKAPAPPPPAGVDAALVRQQVGRVARDRTRRDSPRRRFGRRPSCRFVCEEDVRQAIKRGRKILIGERTIVTPAARDLARGAPGFRDRRLAA